MTLDQAIISILEEQINTYQILNDLLMKERKCLVAIDTERLEDISKEKDTVIMKLRLLEEERQRLIQQFAGENDYSHDINLEELGKLTGKTEFLHIRSKLLSLLQSIEEMNRFNSILIDRSLNHIKTNTNFFNIFRSDRSSQSTGVLLSKET